VLVLRHDISFFTTKTIWKFLSNNRENRYKFSFEQILEPFPMESLTPSKRVHLGEINKRIFEKLDKIDLQTTFMSFSALLKLLSTNKKTYINALRVKF
jgi:hypothetical protein